MSIAQFQAYLRQMIPLAEAMQLEVIQADTFIVQLHAPLHPNRNLHGTAFAGALYSLATLAGWSLTSLCTEAMGGGGTVVLRHADVRYLRPVTGDLNAKACRPDEAATATFFSEWQQKTRARWTIPVLIEQNGKPALQFHGEFVVTRH